MEILLYSKGGSAVFQKYLGHKKKEREKEESKDIGSTVSDEVSHFRNRARAN